MATYKGFWIVFTARDGEVFRDFCSKKEKLGEAIVEAALKIEARGIEPRSLNVTTEDAAIELPPRRKLSRHHFFQHSRDRSHMRKDEKRKKKKHYPAKAKQKGSRRSGQQEMPQKA